MLFHYILFPFVFFFFLCFSKFLEKNEAFLEVLGLKSKFGKKARSCWRGSILLEQLIAGDLWLSALAIEPPSQGTSALGLVYARRRIEHNVIEHNAPAIERIHAPVNSMAADPILEIGLGFVLWFLGFLGFLKIYK